MKSANDAILQILGDGIGGFTTGDIAQQLDRDYGIWRGYPRASQSGETVARLREMEAAGQVRRMDSEKPVVWMKSASPLGVSLARGGVSAKATASPERITSGDQTAAPDSCNRHPDAPWISVIERLPDIEHECLTVAIFDGDYAWPQRYIAWLSHETGGWMSSDFLGVDHVEVTHWMLLPMLPASTSAQRAPSEVQPMHDGAEATRPDEQR